MLCLRTQLLQVALTQLPKATCRTLASLGQCISVQPLCRPRGPCFLFHALSVPVPPPFLLCCVEEVPSSCSPAHPRKSCLRRVALCPLSTVARLTEAISTSLVMHVLERVDNASWMSYKTSVSFAPSCGCTGCLESNTVLSVPCL